MWKQPLKNLKWYGLFKQTIFNFFKGCLHKFYLVHYWILCLICMTSWIDMRSIFLKSVSIFVYLSSTNSTKWQNNGITETTPWFITPWFCLITDHFLFKRNKKILKLIISNCNNFSKILWLLFIRNFRIRKKNAEFIFAFNKM